MGLIDLKTDLKSLRYGKDTIGGGYSGQPYIQAPIPDSFNDLGANEDFILRGGARAIGDAATDIKRLTKMFVDTKSPNGVLFVAKQNLLSQTAVRTQTSDVINEGVYTPLNTLAQAGVIELGGHLNKQGINPFTETGAYANSEILYSVKVKPTQILEENRLARLYQNVKNNSSSKLDGFILNNGPQNVLTYNGGPNSILGAGKTNIRYSSFRTGKQNPLLANGIGSQTYNYFTGSSGVGTPVFLSERQDIPSYINNFDGSVIIDTNNIYNNDLLSKDDFKVLSPFVVNNGLVTSVIPESQRTSGSFYLKSVDTSILEGKGKQIGGLDIDTEKSWIKAPQYELPNFNVNSPQSASLNNTWYTGSSTWTSNQNVNNPFGSNYQISTKKSITYDVANNTGVTNITGLTQPVFVNPSVYQPSGSGKLLAPNDKKVQANDTFTYKNPFVDPDTNLNPNKLKGSPKIQDFRQILRSSLRGKTREQAENSGATPNAPIYSNHNVGDYTNGNQLGNPGQRSGKSYVSYTKGVSYSGNIKALDKINASPIGTGANAPEGGSNNDLVTFNIQPFNSNGSPASDQILNFRAFLGSFSDTYSAEINAQKYVGRGENFYTYNGQTRKISLSWTVAALSKQELIPMYKKLSFLASNTAPIYKDGFMQGPLVSLTVGGYINELPGYIDGLTFEMGEDSTWEIGINDAGQKDPSIAQLTHIIKVSGFSFTPIPTYLPQKGAHFIDLWNGSKNLWKDNATSLT